MSIIDEVREITANEVAKKQDAAKLNYPKIIEKIKTAAGLGFSECRIDSLQMNEYDRQLLQADGFNVSLCDKQHDYKEGYERLRDMQQFTSKKEWIIKW